MFPKHNHKNQILKNVSKTQTQRPNFQTFFQNKDTKIKLSNMFPKHKHNDQIIKHVSKTQTQRSNYQTCVQNKNTEIKLSNFTNTKIKLSNLRRGMSQTQPGQQFLEEKFYIVSLCTIFVQLSPCAQSLHNKLLGKTTSSLQKSPNTSTPPSTTNYIVST